jgi:MSHA biogenesis protein MshQ
VSWDNQASPIGAICRSIADPVPNTKSKCNAPLPSDNVIPIVVLPAITNTDGITTIASGGTTTYQVVISNTTGTTLTNVLFKDPAVSGIAVSGVTCAASGGATCPVVTVAAMQGAGVTIPSLPTGGSLTFSITATLTGSPGDTRTNTATATVTTQTGLSQIASAADTDTITVPAIDHYELSLPTSSITCLPTTATVTACADSSSPCTNASTTISGETATLAASAGTLASTTVTFGATGVASTTLSYPAAADNTAVSVTLSNEQTAAANPRKCCPDGVSCAVANFCSTTFNTAGFIFSSVANGGVATIPTQVAGTTSGTFFLRAVRTNTTTKACAAALAGPNTVNFAYECNDPLTCSPGNLMSIFGSGPSTPIVGANNGGALTYTSVNMAFDVDGNAPFTLNYSDVGLVKLYASKAASGSLLSSLVGSTNSFVVRPHHFDLSAIKCTTANAANCGAGALAMPTPGDNPGALDATGASFIKAGKPFSVTVTARASTGSATPNYGREISPEGVKLTSALVAGLGLTNNPAMGNSTAFGAFTNGVATGTTFDWNEVGIITLTPSVGDGSYLGVGDVVGTTIPNVGRFYPDHFALSGASLTNRTDIGACSTSLFTYMDEPFRVGFTLTAQGPSPGNVTLMNYVTSATAANNFAKLATETPIPAGFGIAYLDVTTNLTTRVDSSLGITGSWAGGVLNATATLAFTRNAAPDGPYNTMRVGIAPVDLDGVTLNAFDMNVVNPPLADDHARVGTTQIRFGRLRLENAYGSELLPLPIPMTVQYWNGTAFITNAADSCTPLLPGNIGFDNYTPNLSTGETTPAVGAAFNAGVGSLILSAPGPGNNGSVDLCVDLGADPVGGTACSATVASMPYLQGLWAPGTAWNNDPKARATFGVYSNPSQFIYLREMY